MNAYTSTLGRKEKGGISLTPPAALWLSPIIVLLSVKSLDDDPCPEPESVHEHFLLHELRQLLGTVNVFFELLLLLFGQRFVQSLSVLGNQVDEMAFLFGHADIVIRLDPSVPQFFQYASHGYTSFQAHHNTTDFGNSPENKLLTFLFLPLSFRVGSSLDLP